MISVYILRLEENKYYIEGIDVDNKCNDDDKYNDEHLCQKINFQISLNDWIIKYKPISIYKIYHNCDKEDVNKYTKIMMSKYGIENVRGGVYNKIELTEMQTMILNTEIENEKECNNCGKRGHLKIDCMNKKLIKEEEEWVCQICDMDFDDENDALEHKYICRRRHNICYMCNKRGHYVSECYNRREKIYVSD